MKDKLQRVILDITKLNSQDNIATFVENTDFIVMQGIRDFAAYSGSGTNECESQADIMRESFLITDNREAADIAIDLGIGFAVYTNDDNNASYFPEALYCIDSISMMSDTNLERMYRRANNLPWHILDTGRCYLREITVDDVDRLYELYKSEEVRLYIEDLYEDKEEEIKYTEDYIKNQYRFYEYGMWVVIEKDTGDLIGRAGIFDRQNQDATELGFMFGIDYWGKGFAKEVLLGIIQYIKDEFEINRLYAHVVNENHRSKKLLKAIGFKYLCEATVEDKTYDRYVYEG